MLYHAQHDERTPSDGEVVSEIFIRILFGRDDYSVRSGILNDLDTAISSPYKLNEQWFVYGLNNLAELEKRGIKDIVLMDEEPLSRFGSVGERNPQHFGTINYGSNMFRHRYPCIANALERYDAVVMLDLDTVAVKPVPEDFWSRCAERAEFQCVLRQGRKPLAFWRKDGMGFVPCGSLQFWRRGKAIQKMLELYADHPERWDPCPLSALADWLVPWEGPQHYKDAGLEPYCHVIREGKQVHPCEDMIFVSGRKKGLRSLAKTPKETSHP